MQSYDVIDVVTPVGGRISEVTLFQDATAVLRELRAVLGDWQFKQRDQL
ncbi:hypothetical protein [Bradyrhizobium sp. Cp5.3]|nr:hypothetical protein [Bradyrhizobium sp. Cp5.3]